jgi:hypothetical protein
MKLRVAVGILFAVFNPSLMSADAPEPPQHLTAVVTGSTVTLTWQAPSTGGVTLNYVVEAALSPAGALIASLPVVGTGIVVPDVPNGIYYVGVRGMNADGASEASNEVIVVVPGGGGGCSTAPNAPLNLTGSATGNVVTLAWSAPVSGCVPTSYAVYAGSAPRLSDIAVVNVGAALALRASAPAGTYYVRVVALNAFGGSAASDEVVFTASGPAPSASVTRWIGVPEDGMIADPGSSECPIEWDLELNLTVNGSSVSGTATTRNRKVQFARCADVFGFVANYDVTGTVGAGGTISLQLGGAFTFTGTVSATSMAGRFIGPNQQPGRFAVTKQ